MRDPAAAECACASADERALRIAACFALIAQILVRKGDALGKTVIHRMSVRHFVFLE